MARKGAPPVSNRGLAEAASIPIKGSRTPVPVAGEFTIRRVLVGGEPTRSAISSGKANGTTLRAVRDLLGITVADAATIVGASTRTITRKEQSREPLTTAETDRAYRLARVADLAVELIGNRTRAIAWLKVPNHYLGDETPLAMLETEIGTDLVVESLYAIAYGGVG